MITEELKGRYLVVALWDIHDRHTLTLRALLLHSMSFCENYASPHQGRHDLFLEAERITYS